MVSQRAQTIGAALIDSFVLALSPRFKRHWAFFGAVLGRSCGADRDARLEVMARSKGHILAN